MKKAESRLFSNHNGLVLHKNSVGGWEVGYRCEAESFWRWIQLAAEQRRTAERLAPAAAAQLIRESAARWAMRASEAKARAILPRDIGIDQWNRLPIRAWVYIFELRCRYGGWWRQ